MLLPVKDSFGGLAVNMLGQVVLNDASFPVQFLQGDPADTLMRFPGIVIDEKVFQTGMEFRSVYSPMQINVILFYSVPEQPDLDVINNSAFAVHTDLDFGIIYIFCPQRTGELPTLADAFMDRLSGPAHKIELKGESLRKKNQ